MCNPASFIVTRHKVLFSKSSDSHEEILRENNIEDMSKYGRVNFVRVEISPPWMDFSIPFASWVYRVDQDLFPDWYDAPSVEHRARARLPSWAAHHLTDLGRGKSDGRTFKLIAYNGNLDLEGTGVTSIPDGLSISGNLNLEYTNTASIPDGLSVGGNLFIRGTLITSIPDGLFVGGKILKDF